MTDKIWFLRREASKAASCSTDCSYTPEVSLIFTFNLHHKLIWSMALSKWTFSKSQIQQYSGYHFGTCKMTATGHWSFYLLTTLSDKWIHRLEPHWARTFLLLFWPLWYSCVTRIVLAMQSLVFNMLSISYTMNQCTNIHPYCNLHLIMVIASHQLKLINWTHQWLWWCSILQNLVACMLTQANRLIQQYPWNSVHRHKCTWYSRWRKSFWLKREHYFMHLWI